ncbi:hypothetical protein CKAH01_13456 [Colletotrichum kahawae]|uniref:Uncharacterized protein n=1 Tax=Colletotrichum kahawae TaxID=34407 RepID=A0AAD9YQR4_COLKA|nr:hypothetical protein CKAH01_13456 [Colletotrichum kahawae]
MLPSSCSAQGSGTLPLCTDQDPAAAQPLRACPT